MRSVVLRSAIVPIVKKSAYFLLLFLLVKSSAFIAPLLASNAALNIKEYGILEFSLTFGILTSVVIDFGGNGAYPFYLLQRREDNLSLSIFYLHYLLLIFLTALLLGINAFSNTLSLKYELAIIASIILGMQTRISTITKAHNQVFLSVLADGGLFLALNFYNLFLWITQSSFSIGDVYWVFVTYGLVLASIFLYQFYLRASSFNTQKYREVLKWGAKIVISTFLVIGLTGGARLLVDLFINTAEVGRYSFYFRLASFMVLIHQAMNIFFFKRIYTATADVFNRYIPIFLLFIFFSCLGVWLIIPPLLAPYLKVLSTYSADDHLLFFILCMQVYYWISMALCENFIYREDLAGKMNKYLLSILILFSGFSFFAYWLGSVTTELIGILNVCCLFLCTEAQYHCLKGKHIKFNKLRLINIAALIAFALVVIIFWI